MTKYELLYEGIKYEKIMQSLICLHVQLYATEIKNKQ
jgi:hypothetical protein